MPKLGMQDTRRRQLIAATLATMHRHGLAETTTQRIAKEAGVSAGIIHHYFDDKNALLAATMRALLKELRADVARRLEAATTPEARIAAVVDANLAPAQFRPAVVAAWLAFWAQSAYDPELRRLRRVYSRRTHSNLKSALEALLPADAARTTALTLAAMIDGFWLRAGQADGDLDHAAARAQARAYLALVLADAHAAG